MLVYFRYGHIEKVFAWPGHALLIEVPLAVDGLLVLAIQHANESLSRWEEQSIGFNELQLGFFVGIISTQRDICHAHFNLCSHRREQSEHNFMCDKKLDEFLSLTALEMRKRRTSNC